MLNTPKQKTLDFILKSPSPGLLYSAQSAWRNSAPRAHPSPTPIEQRITFRVRRFALSGIFDKHEVGFVAVDLIVEQPAPVCRKTQSRQRARERSPMLG